MPLSRLMTTSPDSPLNACARASAQVASIEQFKEWTRSSVRTVLPHGTVACAHGRLYAAGVITDYLVTVDYPREHLAAIRNPSGEWETPLVRRWLALRQPVFFDAADPPADTPPVWLAHFRKHQLINAAAYGVIDETNCIASYFSFHRLPVLDENHLHGVLMDLTPLLHDTLTRVTNLERQASARQLRHDQSLSPREQEIARWVCNGKSNADIAQLLGTSVNTVRNQVSTIFQKAGCSNRAGLAALMSQREGGIKVL